MNDAALALLGNQNNPVTAAIYGQNISNHLKPGTKGITASTLPVKVELFSTLTTAFIDNTELYRIIASLKELDK